MIPPRTTFLNRVKKALGHKADQPAPPPADRPAIAEDLLRQVSPDDPTRLDRWMQLAVKNGMKVEKVNAQGLTSAIGRCLGEHLVKRALLNLGTFAGQSKIEEFLAAAGIEVHPWGAPDCRAMAYQCEASITDCRYGLADTGAIMVWCDTTFGRSSTLTVPIHIVLLRAERILPDLIDGLARIHEDCGGQIPSNVVVINGPSKTADIEMNLITGVHGPKYVYVLVVEE